MNEDPGAAPAGTGLSGDAAGDPAAVRPWGRPQPARHILFIAWRDLASRLAGGSEVLVDQLACGVRPAATG